MAFDTFDEGIEPGGIRSKNEIRILICYLFDSVGEGMSKDLIVQAILKQGLANYFETSSAFDDLIINGNLQKNSGDGTEQTYMLTENGKMIARQLDTTLAYTVKEKAYACATKLLAQKKTERENSVEIIKSENGFNVVCKISGSDVDLLSFSLYVPSMEQALMIKKNFYQSPSTVYNTVLAFLTNDKENVAQALEDLYAIL
ncbi:MAG: DUF4364 family protein [Clostridiales bacterium]|nr:DUF4364 family protein [Clostridiales bacterium]